MFWISNEVYFLQRRISFLLVSNLWPCMMRGMWSCGIYPVTLCFQRMMLVKTGQHLLLVSYRSSTMLWLFKVWLLLWRKSTFLIFKYLLMLSNLSLKVYFMLFSITMYFFLWLTCHALLITRSSSRFTFITE